VFLCGDHGAHHDPTSAHQHVGHPARRSSERYKRMVAHWGRGPHRASAYILWKDAPPFGFCLPIFADHEPVRFFLGGSQERLAGAGVIPGESDYAEAVARAALAGVRRVSLSNGHLQKRTALAAVWDQPVAAPVDLHWL